MDGKIKGSRYTDILAHILVPLTLYLFIGLTAIHLSGIEVSNAYYVFWGIMAVIAVGIREYVHNETVTVGIGIYVAAVALWFYHYKEGQYKVHIVLAVVGLCAVFLLWKLLKQKWVRVCVGYAALLTLIGFEFADISFSKGIIALAIFLFLYSVSETISNLNSFIVIYIVAALAVIVTPAPEEPYDWNFVVSAARAVGKMAETLSIEVEYQLKRWGWDGVFHYGATGYSDSSMSLSMGLGDRDVEQMTLWGGKTTRNFYLKGNVCDNYLGDTWETAVLEETIDYQTDTLMTLYAIFDYTQEKQELRQFMKVHKQELTIQNIKTQSLFHPLKTFEITARNIQVTGDNLRVDKVFPRGISYSYSFVDIDYASDEMIDILAHSKDITYNEATYDAIFEKMWLYYNARIEKPPYEDFLAKVMNGQKAIKEQYTAPGDAVSDEVRNLADSITADCRNDYEKCRALETYLSQYNYNKGIHVPEDADILDWFLFEGKEGYCVHYATALATMLRCEGIPSRIAEGFLVEYENRVEANRYSISSSSAHAWVEAYLDGIGWVRLEPTAAFAGNAHEQWYSDSDEEETEEEEEEEETEPDELSGEAEEQEQKADGGNGDIGLLVGILFGGMAVVAGIILLSVFIYHKIRLQKSNNPDVILAHILSILGKRYVPREDEETVREYFQRLSQTERMPNDISENLAAVIEVTEAYWYGSRILKEEDLCKMKEIRDGLLQKNPKKQAGKG